MTRAPAERASPRAPCPAGRSSPRRSRPPRSQPGTAAQRGERVVGRLGRDEGDERALVGDVHRVDAEDLAGAGDRRAAPARPPRARRTATPEARASSLSTDATPPRVASRMHRSDGPAASSSASTAGQSERVSDSIRRLELELAAGEHDRRAVLADRPGDEDPVARPERLTARALRARVDRGRARSCVMYIESQRPRSTTFVSPADDLRRRPPRRRARSPRPRRAARRPPRPSSRTSESVSASGRAPPTARSLTVPLTASSPIEPPGKRIGLTTKLSVVTARGRRRARRRRASSVDRRSAGASRPSTSACVALPPAPCAIVICVVTEAQGLRADALDHLERVAASSTALTRPPARGRSARSCSRRRRRPRTRPCTCRSAAPACRRCRRPCTPTA